MLGEHWGRQFARSHQSLRYYSDSTECAFKSAKTTKDRVRGLSCCYMRVAHQRVQYQEISGGSGKEHCETGFVSPAGASKDYQSSQTHYAPVTSELLGANRCTPSHCLLSNAMLSYAQVRLRQLIICTQRVGITSIKRTINTLAYIPELWLRGQLTCLASSSVISEIGDFPSLLSPFSINPNRFFLISHHISLLSPPSSPDSNFCFRALTKPL